MARLAAPTLFAATAVIGMAWTVGSLIANPAPTLGYYRFINDDALALVYGQGLYHDPAGRGYLAAMYPPLMPALIALFDTVHLWDGWGVVVNVLATAALGGVTSRVAYRAAGAQGPLAMVRAIGIGGLGVWLATTAFGILYVPWVDPLAWAFALSGLVLVASAERSRVALLAGVALLTAGLWTKQTTLVAPVAAVAWLVLAAWRGRVHWRLPATLAVALVAVNGALFGIAQLVSDGWEVFFTISVPYHHVLVFGFGTLIHDVYQACGIPLLAAGSALVVAVLLGGGRAGESAQVDLAALLAVFVVVALPVTMYFRQNAGANQYYYIGVDWGLALLAAVAIGMAQRAEHGRVAADCVIGALAAFAIVGTINRAPRFDFRSQHVTFGSIPSDLRAVAARVTLYDPAYSDLGSSRTHRVLPPLENAVALWSAGAQAKGLVSDLVTRRFDAVVPFSVAVAPLYAYYNAYSAGFGRYEDNYLWKLDAVIGAGYEPATGYPSGVLVRRPGPDLALALRSCFGPFRLGGVEFEIRRGGGLWCASGPGSQTMSMRGSPASISQLVSRDPLSPSGTVAISATRPSSGFTLFFASGSATWEVDGNPRAGGWALRLLRSGQPPRYVRIYSGGRVLVRLTPASGAGLSASPGGVVRAPVVRRSQQGQLTIAATTAGDVSFDLGRFRASL